MFIYLTIFDCIFGCCILKKSMYTNNNSHTYYYHRVYIPLRYYPHAQKVFGWVLLEKNIIFMMHLIKMFLVDTGHQQNRTEQGLL